MFFTTMLWFPTRKWLIEFNKDIEHAAVVRQLVSLLTSSFSRWPLSYALFHACSLAHLNPSFFALVFSHVNNPAQRCFPHCSLFCSAEYAENFYLQKNLTPHPAVSHVLLRQGLTKSFACISPEGSLTGYCYLNIQIKVLNSLCTSAT